MKFVFVVLLVMLFQASAGWADSVETSVKEAITKLEQGDKSGLVIPLYKNPEEAAVLFTKHARFLTDDEIRTELIIFALNLERNAPEEAKGPCCSSKNEALAAQLAIIVEQDSSESVRGAAAVALRELFLPEVLDNYAKNIRNAAMHWTQREILLLYGALPSNDSKEVLELLSKEEFLDELDRYCIDSILARYGDEAAQGRLIEIAESLSESCWVEIERIIDALSYVPTREMKQTLAEGLRSDEMIQLAGGSAIPRRSVFAYALVKMMCVESGFPVKSASYFYSDEELDEIEQWCQKHLGVQFPDEPRKKLFIIPHIEPLP